MASILALKNKEGIVYGYQIQVFRGRDSAGKKLKPYSTTWRIPETWKSKSKIQKELQRVTAEFENDCSAGKIAIETKTFEQYTKYIMKIKERDCKHRTVFRYKQLLERMYPELGHIKMSNISASDLNKMYMKWSKEGSNKNTGKALSPRTIMHHHRLLHMIFAQAVKEGLLQFNIAERATPPKVPKTEAGFFELEDVLNIREALLSESLKWQVIINLFVGTGARRGEIMGLKWKAIDFQANNINIENNLQYTPEKGLYDETPKADESRIISVDAELIMLLKQYRKEQLQKQLSFGTYWKETGYCFTRDNGLPCHPDSLNEWLTRFSKRHKLPHINPHKFRHTQASLLYSLNVDPVTISKRLGHSEVSTTQDIYSHLLKDSDHKASDALTALLKSK